MPGRMVHARTGNGRYSMAIDPICGMTVDEATGRSVELNNQTFYFCCENCRQKFLASRQAGEQQHQARPHKPAPEKKQLSGKYFCPMCEGVESNKPGTCPKCGMALEPARPAAPKRTVIYTCPMHPEIEQDGPGTCPKCGMDLEPKTVVPGTDEDDSELRNMTRRFWVALAATIPVLLLAMSPMLGVPVDRWMGATRYLWLQLLLSTPVVLWGGWPFFERGWRSIVTWNLNMF